MSKWLQIKNKADGSIDEIYIYGEIGDYWGELDAKTLSEKLKNSSGDEISIRINSGGGEVFTATAFYSLLKSSGKKINVFIDGLAASAATLIACAGDRVIMPVNALYMIHNPLSWTYGNAEEMREMANLLDTVRNTLVATYKQKTGLEDAKIIEMMDNESWLTAHEALALGFIDEIMDVAVAATTKDVINMSSERLKNIPTQFDNAVKSLNEKPKGDTKPMDLAQFKAQHGDVAKAHAEEIKASFTLDIQNAKKAERQRVLDIQNTAFDGQSELVAKAIDEGTPAGAFAIQANQAMKAAEQSKKDNFLAKTEADRQQTEGVAPSKAPKAEKTPEELEQAKVDAFFDDSFTNELNKGIK